MGSYYGGVNSNINHYGRMQIYEVTYWEDGVAKAYLVPCYRTSDNVYGLYDVISGAFYAGANNALTGGPAVAKITAETKFVAGANVTLTAMWTPNKYTVSYDFAGGTNGSKYPTSWTYDVAQEVSAPTRAGYTFAGYKVTSGLDTSTGKWGTSSSPTTSVSAATTVCFNTATTSVYFKNLTVRGLNKK